MQRILENCLAHKKHLINGDYCCWSLPLQTWEHVGSIMLHNGHMTCPRQKRDAPCFHPKPLPIFLVSFPSIDKDNNNTANNDRGQDTTWENWRRWLAKTIQLISSKIRSHSWPGSRVQALTERTVNCKWDVSESTHALHSSHCCPDTVLALTTIRGMT